MKSLQAIALALGLSAVTVLGAASAAGAAPYYESPPIVQIGRSGGTRRPS